MVRTPTCAAKVCQFDSWLIDSNVLLRTAARGGGWTELTNVPYSLIGRAPEDSGFGGPAMTSCGYLVSNREFHVPSAIIRFVLYSVFMYALKGLACRAHATLSSSHACARLSLPACLWLHQPLFLRMHWQCNAFWYFYILLFHRLTECSRLTKSS